MRIACLFGRHQWTGTLDLAIVGVEGDHYPNLNTGSLAIRTCARCRAVYAYGYAVIRGGSEPTVVEPE